MSKSPETTYRLGHVSASVFVNEVSGDGGKRKFRSVNVQRSYRDGDETKYTNSFGRSDLPTAIRCLQLAQAHVETKEAQTE